MKNRIQITTDGKQAHATIEVNASRIGTSILIGFISLEIAGLIWALTLMPMEELIYKSIPILLIVLFFIGFPIKYLLWNLYGQEKLIVSKQMIQWSYHYGFFGGQLNEEDYESLAIVYERIRDIKDKEVGRLLFYSAESEDTEGRLIHKTSCLITKEEAITLSDKIWTVIGEENRVLDYNVE